MEWKILIASAVSSVTATWLTRFYIARTSRRIDEITKVHGARRAAQELLYAAGDFDAAIRLITAPYPYERHEDQQ